MNFHILVSKGAKLDILEAHEWYEAQSLGLGQKFEHEISKAIDELIYQPKKFQIKYRDIIIYYLKHFPYGIHFQINDVSHSILILAVFHTSRKPKS